MLDLFTSVEPNDKACSSYNPDNDDEDKDIVLFENPSFESAIIGLSSDNRVVYSYDKMIDFLMSDKNYKMNETEAMDWVDNGCIGYDDFHMPIVMY